MRRRYWILLHLLIGLFLFSLGQYFWAVEASEVGRASGLLGGVILVLLALWGLSFRRSNEMKIVVGLVLLSLGVTLFLFSFLIATKADTVIDISFVLEPNEKYGPYENGTYYHTRVISKSTLMGEVLVEGGGAYFTANGYNTGHLKNIFINQNYSLVIDPADDLYTFTFENTGGNLQSSIKFTLKERWMDILSLIPAFIILLISAPVGTVLIVAGLRKKTKEKREDSLKSAGG